MPQSSALTATVLLFFALLNFYFAHSGDAETKAQMSSLLWVVYVLALTVSGWLYLFSKKSFLGIIHSVLMLGASGVCGFVSLQAFFGKQHMMGGSGPDANPAGPVLMLGALLVGAVGVAALTLGCGVARHCLKDKNGGTRIT